MSESSTHICFYSDRLVWGGWERSGELAERVARRVPICTVCGRERSSVRPRPPVRREVRAEVPSAPPLADEAGRTVAAVLVRRGGHEGTREVAAAGLLTKLAQRGIPASLAEEWIDHFLRAGWLVGRWLVGRGDNRLESARLRNREALRELAKPGVDARRRAALAAAREKVASLSHPKALEIAAFLFGDEAGMLSSKAAAALAALAVHVEADEPLAERVFSSRALGDSKALAAVRGRLERLLGPLSELGIREGGGVTLLGGRGALRLADTVFDLALLAPFAGFSRDTLEKAAEIRFPSGGLLVVENLAAFEACCRGEVPGTGEALVVWSAGYPGRAVRRVVTAAASAGARVRIWADLDLDGVRIARLVASWGTGSASGIAPWRMARRDLLAAPVSRPLPQRAVAAIQRDLEERPGALLADTLRALLETQSWVEQEAFLALPRSVSETDS